MSQGLTNSKKRDASSKIIFEDPVLCAQFLRGYMDIPLLKDVQPEDIEDVTSRYVHMFVEERDSDVAKRVHIKSNGIPFIWFLLLNINPHFRRLCSGLPMCFDAGKKI